MADQRLLGQRDAVDAFGPRDIDTAEEDDEGGARADQDRVDEDRQRLHHALSAGMLHIGHRGDVRGRSQPGFVREQAAAQALGDGGAHPPGNRLVEAEGAGNDVPEHSGDRGQVHQDDHQRHADIAEGHDRDDHVGHLGDPLDPAIDHQAGEDREEDAAPQPADAQAVRGGTGDGVALEGVEAKREGRDQADRIDDRQPAELRAEAVDDVEGRPAAIGPVRFRPLVELGERTFEEAGAHAHQRDRPHPEHRARAADADRHRHPGDVAAADPAPDRDQQRLARADMALGAGLVALQHRPHPPEIADLHQPRDQREGDAQNDKERDQRPSPGEIAYCVEEAFDETHACSFPFPACSLRDAGSRNREWHRLGQG